MPVKEINLPEIGLVKIYKRQGLKNMRLSLPRTDYVRLTMPAWLPYKAGIVFIKQKQGWIKINKPKIKPALKKPIKEDAEAYLKPRLSELAQLHGYSYNKVSFRYLKSRWGSCNAKKEITLNIMLMHLPHKLIDHVLVHELVHTKILKHGPDFWHEFENVLPNAKHQRKLLNKQHPFI